ncbi:MAG: oxalurate catabolism protein HpxZ [Rhizonema sp. PD37]|nr:oxalurate catabolism protein HpxZ [Rhizonema sp. PD37]
MNENDANKTLLPQLQMNLSSVVAEVTDVFNRYEQALVTNDVSVLDELFFNSPKTIRYGVLEESIGYQAIQEFRLGRNPTNLARDLQNTTITTYGHDFAVASTEFTRQTSPNKLGRQQQTWIRTEQGWRIVAAHVSIREKQ